MRWTLDGPGGTKIYSHILQSLLAELFTPDEITTIRQLAPADRIDPAAFTSFDYWLGGPSVLTISDPGFTGGTLNFPSQGVGRYQVADREVFRPLQYCAAHLMMVDERAVWLARAVVSDSSAHIEGLVKRIGRLRFLPLGSMLRKRAVAAVLDPTTLNLALRYTPIFNAAKHDFSQDKDTHMFSLQDALTAYFVCRRLAFRLYPLASLATNLHVFDVEPASFDPASGRLTRASS